MTQSAKNILFVSIVTSIIAVCSKVKGFTFQGDIFLAISSTAWLLLIFGIMADRKNSNREPEE
ncbi:MAG TPA: hypothetical protein VF581_05745 [Flavobacterium sp.]|jgi:hypothetical protein